GSSSYDEELSKTLTDLSEDVSYIVLSNTRDFTDKIISKEVFKESVMEMKEGEELSFEEFLTALGKHNFIQKDFVEEVGDFSVRGGIVDLFPESYHTPIRVEFFGDTIESIREFDISTQRSLKKIGSVRVGMNLNTEDAFSDDKKHIPTENTILDYISPDTLIIINEPQIALNEIHEIRDRLSGNNIIYTTSFLTTGHIEEADKSELKIDFASKPQPDIRSNLKILYGSISE